MTGKNYLDPLFADLSALISRGLEALFGPGVNAAVFGNVIWADLGTVLCLVLVVLFVNGLAVAFLRRKTRQAAATAGKELHHHVFGALGKPLYVLIWIYGIYLAATPLLLKLPPDEGLDVVRAVFRQAVRSRRVRGGVLAVLPVHARAGSAAGGLGGQNRAASWTTCSCR